MYFLSFDKIFQSEKCTTGALRTFKVNDAVWQNIMSPSWHSQELV
jgi:hypothetical protein